MIETKAKINRYESYIDSGVEWLGEVPEHWSVLPSKRFHKVFKYLNSKRDCNNVLSLTLRGVVNNNLDSPEGMVPKDYGTYQVFNKNDLVFKLIDLENVKTSRVGIVHEKGIMSSAYIRLAIGQNSFPRFAYYYFFSLYINEVYNNLGSGVRSTLGPNDLLKIPFVNPTLSEQTKIAQFLDDKTNKTEDAIAIKEQQIKLLKERKQILIHKAVTQGLNPKVALKDSGVEWIGEIPEHWRIPKLKHVCQFILDGTHGSYTRVDNGYRLLSVRNIINNKFVFRDDDSMVTKKHFKEISSKFLIQNGDIQLAIVGATLGKVALVESLNEKIVTQRSLSTIRVNSKVSNTYLFYYLQSSLFQSFLWNNTGFSAQPGIYLGTIQNCHIPIPNKEEQKEISEYIETTSQKIETAISLKQQEIEKLKEYKSSLINSVVTGKIKVC